MTQEERKEMFAKDYLNTGDIEKLLGVKAHKAMNIMKTIRFHSDRLGINGKVHVQDYLDYFHLDPKQYYRTEENQ